MAVLNFPTSPTDGQEYTAAGITYAYDAAVGAWLIVPETLAPGSVMTIDGVDTTRYIVFAGTTTGSFALANVDLDLTYNPSTGTLSSTIFNSTSDQYLKYDISQITNALVSLDQIRGVKYSWKHSHNQSMGVIAQDVANVYPELVTTDGQWMTVNYNGLVGVLIEAVKELKREIDDLKAKYSEKDK